MATLKTLIVPVPPKGLSAGVCDAVAQLAPAQVELLTVVAPNSRVNPHTGLPDDGFEEIRWSEDAERAESALEEAAQLLTVTPCRRRVERGVPAEQIVKQALEAEASLIVMATRGNTGLKRALLGSVTDAVLRRSPCPVVVVPPEGGAG